MPVSTIDGTLETAILKRRARAVSIYEKLVIRRGDGGEERLGKTIVANKVAEALKPGTSGRFYLYSAIDHKGMHGVRSAQTAVHDFPVTNERLMLFVLVVNLILLIGRIVLDGTIWFLPLALVVLAAVVYPLYRKTRIESRRQFDADAGYVP